LARGYGYGAKRYQQRSQGRGNGQGIVILFVLGGVPVLLVALGRIIDWLS